MNNYLDDREKLLEKISGNQNLNKILDLLNRIEDCKDSEQELRIQLPYSSAQAIRKPQWG